MPRAATDSPQNDGNSGSDSDYDDENVDGARTEDSSWHDSGEGGDGGAVGAHTDDSSWNDDSDGNDDDGHGGGGGFGSRRSWE